ncbi:MAG: O-antigen ligase family protein, partial [Blastocatellia bacterium]
LLSDLFAGAIPAIAVCKDALMVIVFASFFARYLRRRWRVNATLYLFLGFAALSALYVPLAPDWMRATLQLRCLTLYPLISLLVANLIETPQDLRRMLRLIAVVGVMTVVYGLAQYLTMFDVSYRIAGGAVTQRMGRFEGFGVVSTFASRPSFGGYLIPLFLLLLQVKLWPSTKIYLKIWWTLRWLALSSSAVCLILTYSRTIWIATLVGLFVILYLRDKMKAVLMALALGACLLIAYQAKSFFLSSSMEEAVTSGESFQARLSYWPRVLGYVLANPLGIGLGTVGGPHLFESRAQADTYGNLSYDPQTMFDSTGGLNADNMLAVTDNSYLKLLIQGGFPLLFVFLWLVASVLKLASNTLSGLGAQGRNPALASFDSWIRDVAIWASASFASLLTIFMFVDFFEAAPSISIYWLAVGALCCVRKMAQDQVAGRMKR